MATEFIDVVVLAKDENFNAEGYLLVNPDVAAAAVDPHMHFLKFGRAEGRRQLNTNYLNDSIALRRRKFEIFSPDLTFDTGKASTFPVSMAGTLHRREEYQAESSNGESSALVIECLNNPDKKYMNLGGGLSHKVLVNCLNVEVYPSLTADLIVPPSCTYPVKDNSLDGIACLAVLEHTRKPWLVVSEMYRMLKQGGRVWIDWPFLQPVHGYPSHYYNATREGLRAMFEDAGFETTAINTYPHQDFDYTFTWTLGELMRKLPATTRKRIEKMSVKDFLAHPPASPFWRQIIAEVDEKTREALACGNSLTAIKR